MISLFIDANVYLRFYAYTDDDLIELEKLHALIEAGELRLFKNEQLEDEVARNRESKISSALETFKKSGPNIQIPRFALHFDEAQQLLELSKQFQDAKTGLNSKINEEIEQGELRADNLIKQLLAAAKDLPVDGGVLERARWRQVRGNPPGKSDSIGDQIHWETLLDGAEAGQNLHIVSNDRDFASKLDPEAPNSKLAEEWTEKCGGALSVYKSLGDFAKAHFGDIKLPSDVKKASAISKLVNTTNFENTHKQISRLSELFSEITTEEALIILQAIIDNNQIGWIADDEDVRSFYTKLYMKFFLDTPLEMDQQLSGVAKYFESLPF